MINGNRPRLRIGKIRFDFNGIVLLALQWEVYFPFVASVCFQTVGYQLL